MMRSSAYNRFGVLMGTSSRAACPRWLSLRGDSLPMITLISSQGDFCATAFSQTPAEDLTQERQRFAAHRQRFRLQSRSLRQTQAQFNQLRQQWSALKATGTG